MKWTGVGEGDGRKRGPKPQIYASTNNADGILGKKQGQIPKRCSAPNRQVTSWNIYLTGFLPSKPAFLKMRGWGGPGPHY